MTTAYIRFRRRFICYSGELRWTDWGVLEEMRYLKPGTDPEARLNYWRELNDYAVKARGEGARWQLELVQP